MNVVWLHSFRTEFDFDPIVAVRFSNKWAVIRTAMFIQYLFILFPARRRKVNLP